MAGWMDFLAEPITGYSDVKPEAISEGAEFGQGGGFKTANSNITWGQLLSAITKMSNTQGGQALSSFMAQQYGVPGTGIAPQPGTTNTGAVPSNQQSQPQIYKIGPTAGFMQPEQKDNTSIGEIAAVAKMFV